MKFNNIKILYLDPVHKGIYYEQFRSALINQADVFLYGPGRPNYSKKHNISDILYIYKEYNNCLPDLILFGYGWENDTSMGSDCSVQECELGAENINIIKAFILNKEYKNLDQKLNFISKNKIDVVYTAHHNFDEYSKITKTVFYQLPFAANKNIFKNYELEKTIDIGFSGNMFNKGVYKDTNIMGDYFQNIREKIYTELQKSKYKNLNIWWNSNSGQYLYGQEYGKLINSSKIWLNTPSAIKIVGTRYYEVIASKTLLFCRECDVAYEGLGFEDGQTCVTFKSDLSDFEEKLFYYLKNEDAREKIVSRAYKMFIENHTWQHRAKFVIEKSLGAK
jgi:spore maturation protein CgeB